MTRQRLAIDENDSNAERPIPLWEILEQSAQQWGEATALVSFHQQATQLEWILKPEDRKRNPTGRLEMTYSQLLLAAQRLGANLAAAGLRRGDIAMVLLPNCAEQILLFWACAWLGAVCAPINPQLIDRAETGELRHVFAQLKPTFIATSDENYAKKFEEGIPDLATCTHLNLKWLAFQSGKKPDNSQWIAAQDLSQADRSLSEHTGDETRRTESIAVLLATSGTTSLPKMCPHTEANLDFESRQYYAINSLGPDSKELAHGPNFHIAAVVRNLMVWRAGATLVLPSAKFDADAIFDALKTLRCTHMSGVPSLLTSLFSRTDYPSDHRFEIVRLYGEPMSMTATDQSRLAARARKVLNIWGMTEGVYGIGCRQGEALVWRNEVMSCGRALPATAAKVCKPESTEIVERGQLGELLVSGPNMIQGYYQAGETLQDGSFCQENGKVWFRTGDTVIMDDLGNIFVTGRYKDLIIRGGENIHPRLIEQCLDKLPGVKSQVIGVDDADTQTQSINAVIRMAAVGEDADDIKSKAQRLVLAELGPAYRPTAVYLISELGYEEYPMTATGKVRKTELREKIVEMSSCITQPVQRESTVAAIIDIWRHLLGPMSSDLDGHASISQFADSLISLKFCLQVERKFGERITPADLSEHETPYALARLLDAQSEKEQGHDHDPQARDPMDDSWISAQDKERALACLADLDSAWEDVESVYQPGGSMPLLMVRTTRPASVNVRFVWRAKIESSTSHIEDCLAWALIKHQALRAVLAPLETDTTNPRVLHLAMKPSKKWLSRIITEAAPINESDIAGLVHDSYMPCAPIGGPAVQVRILPVNGSRKAAIFLVANHAVFDAMSFGYFKEDLDRRLSGQIKGFSKWIPYSAFADMYRSYQGSSMGERNVAYHVNKLKKQLPDAEGCLWPTAKGPGFMTGPDDLWMNGNMTLGSPSQRVSLEGNKDKITPVVRVIPLPDLSTLQQRFAVVPSTVLKAALAILNVEMTGQDRAVFSHTDAGRRWPFMEPWIERQLPNVMQVAGPTLEWNFDFVAVKSGQTAGNLMSNVAEAQNLDIQHCHSPLDKLIERLGPLGGLLKQIAVRQVFNWDSSMSQNSPQNATNAAFLEKAGVYAFLDVGVYWNCGLLAPNQVLVWSVFDDTHVSRNDMNKAIGRLADITVWLSDPDHWNSHLSGVMQQ